MFRGHMVLMTLRVKKSLERFTKRNFKKQIKKSSELTIKRNCNQEIIKEKKQSREKVINYTSNEKAKIV